MSHSHPQVESDARRATLMLGVPVDDVTMEETVDAIFRLAADGRATGRCHQVATVNVDFLVNAVRHPDVADVLRRTSLSIPDGMPIVWGSRLLRAPIRERVAGADLVSAIAERAAQVGARIALYGAAPGVAERAAVTLQRAHPGAEIVHDAGPDFRTVDELTPDDLRGLRALGPDICCVAFGNPKQERFIARFGAELGIPVMIGVGGSLDFLVGAQRRAPAWMQRSGLEWLHRAWREPGRLGLRYVRDATVFLPRLAAQAWTGRRRRALGEARIESREDGVIALDLRSLRAADNATAGRITGVVRAARILDQRIQVVGPDTALRSVPGLAEVVDSVRDRVNPPV